MNIKVNSPDEIFAAGDKVTVSDTSADHLVIAGGELEVTKVAVEDLYAAGGKIAFLSGEVADDVVSAGGELTARPGFSIGGSAVMSGGTLRIESPIGGQLKAAGENIYVNSAIGSTAQLMGDKVELGPKARIDGDLEYRTENLKISPSAMITGQRIAMPAEKNAEFERWGKGGAALFAAFSLIGLIALSTMVVVIALLFPGLIQQLHPSDPAGANKTESSENERLLINYPAQFPSVPVCLDQAFRDP